MAPNRLLQQLREERGMSQEEVAKALSISRPTYSAFEQGKRELTLAEAERASQLFSISIENIVLGKKPKVHNVVLGDKDIEVSVRENIPKEDHDKFREVLLYILSKTAGKHNVGITVLYKLLYFIDFDYYEKYGEQLMGLRYIKNHYGPTPKKFTALVEKMKEKGDLEEVHTNFFSRDMRKLLPHKEANLSRLTGRELEMIDDVLARYSDKTAKELSELTHEDTPWVVAEEGKNLEYEHVFYRPEKLSVGRYESL